MTPVEILTARRKVVEQEIHANTQRLANAESSARLCAVYIEKYRIELAAIDEAIHKLDVPKD